jgi:hypothetical protein
MGPGHSGQPYAADRVGAAARAFTWGPLCPPKAVAAVADPCGSWTLIRQGRNCGSTISNRSDSQAGLCDAEIRPRGLRPNQRAAPICEAAFASLKALVRLVRAPVDVTDASEEREDSGRRRIAPYDNRKTTARPVRNS